MKNFLSIAFAIVCATRLVAQPPAFDHVVIVIEENHSFGDIIGNTSAAPNINALAAAGANIVNDPNDPQGNISGSHAVRHPSQPNYLEFYSGSSQGTVEDGHPGSPPEVFSSPPPFTTPNLGAALRNAGFSFATYSQTLPSVGFDGDSNGEYMRKHNPVTNWMNDTNPTANQYPSTLNQPFTTFQDIMNSPGGFANLPKVCYVVPDQTYDMHDGTIQQGDDWLKTNIIDTYLPWAMTHNSLLIVTWDEDGTNTPTNQIPTIFAGAKVKPGNYTETNLNANNPHVGSPTDPGIQTPTGTAMNHYNVLSTVEDIYGLTHIGGSANRRPVSDIFTTPIFLGPLVVPNEWSTAFGDAGNLFPLFSDQPIRYQQIFDASQFSRLNPGGGLINRIAFRGHGPGTPFTGTVPQLQVNLSTTSKAPDNLSSTFADNVGADDTQVFSGPLGAAVTFTGDATNFEVVINFTTPFYYDPAKGNLLLDVRNMQGGTEVPPLNQEIDGTSAVGDSVSRVYNYGDVNASTAGQTGGVDEKDSYGLVTEFSAINAVSRKVHGGQTFDVGLPLVGTAGIECRSGRATNDFQVVVTFGGPVTFSTAQVTQGTGSVASTSMNGNQVFINLTGITNAQTIQVTLAAVNDGSTTQNVTIPMSILLGDVNGSGRVDAADVSSVRQQTLQPVTISNFREDVNTSGRIDAADVSIARQQTLTSLP
jgi:hypothetical protein